MTSDPVILKKIGTKKIYLHQSHKLPEYRRLFPFYDQALPRICQAVKEIDNNLTLIDVGANVGDSVALITDKVSGSFLCVEGDKKYLPVLKKNIAKFKSSTLEIESSYCGDGTKSTLSIINENGTARLVETDNSKVENIKTLDQMINEHPKFKSANILKIDTDGFEINVIKGAANFLKSTKPIIYFEFTPELYQNLKQDPFEIISILYHSGYESAMFYDNFGHPIGIVNLSDTDKIQGLINQIDKKNIYYYDVLTFPKTKPKYEKLFNQELLGHAQKASQEVKRLTKYSSLKKEEQDQLKTQLTDSQNDLFESQAQLQKILPQIALSRKESKRYIAKIKGLESKLSKEKDYLSQQIVQLQSDLLCTQKEKDNLTATLRKFYDSKIWRLMRHYYLLRDKLFLKDNRLIRKLFTILKSIKNPPPPKTLRHINLGSNKLVYIDHIFHRNKTKSTEFIVDIFKKYFNVETIWHDSWHGDNFPDLSHINRSYLGVVFFQTLPSPEVYKKINNPNIIFFPMFDGHGYLPESYWRKYPNLKIVNFSQTLHNKLISWGFDSTYVQYFPKPLPFKETTTTKVFFWQRINYININTVEILLDNIKAKIHLHRHVDPNQTFITPSSKQIKKHSITFSDWFETRSQMQQKIQECDIYIAPRQYEGIGLGFLEAMAMGKAVIAVNNPTMNEYITDGHTGYLYEMENPQPINLSKLAQVRKDTYSYMKQGWKKWQTDKTKIVEFVRRP